MSDLTANARNSAPTNIGGLQEAERAGRETQPGGASLEAAHGPPPTAADKKGKNIVSRALADVGTASLKAFKAMAGRSVEKPVIDPQSKDWTGPSVKLDNGLSIEQVRSNIKTIDDMTVGSLKIPMKIKELMAQSPTLMSRLEKYDDAGFKLKFIPAGQAAFTPFDANNKRLNLSLDLAKSDPEQFMMDLSRQLVSNLSTVSGGAELSNVEIDEVLDRIASELGITRSPDDPKAGENAEQPEMHSRESTISGRQRDATGVGSSGDRKSVVEEIDPSEEPKSEATKPKLSFEKELQQKVEQFRLRNPWV
ncbi:MAG: hypothetical protein AAFQ09_06490 [Pseudomonadota bacterium]